MKYHFAIGVLASIGMTGAPALAVVTADSTTWENSYEADVLPSADGFTTAGTVANFTTLTGTGAVRLNNIGDDTNTFGWWTAAGGLDFSTGVSVEIRAKVNDPSSGANSMFLHFSDSANEMIRLRLFGAGQVQVADGLGFAWQSIGVDVSQYQTYRITAELGTNNVNTYLNDNPVPVATGTLDSLGASLGGMNFGDATGSTRADWEIDYIRWTDQGTFAAIPEPASLGAMLLGGLALLRRRSASR